MKPQERLLPRFGDLELMTLGPDRQCQLSAQPARFSSWPRLSGIAALQVYALLHTRR